MDAKSIAATARNGGILTPATDFDVNYTQRPYHFDRKVYDNRCWFGFGAPQSEVAIQLGPNITDWPEMQPLAEHLLLEMDSVILDPVTTTDELIPSGETSSLRSNPLRLAEFALSRRDPGYVGRAKAVQQQEKRRLAGEAPDSEALCAAFAQAQQLTGGEAQLQNTGFGSVIYANRPGDGSAREQAASCQKVLGSFANIAREYATKRYRSNLINWGMLPFLFRDELCFDVGDYIFVPGIRSAVERGDLEFQAYLIKGDTCRPIQLSMSELVPMSSSVISVSFSQLESQTKNEVIWSLG